MIALLLALLPILSTQQDNAEFLIENAKLCGEPFADPIWIPVLDTCTIECDQLKEYCVENEELVQQCKLLPDDCRNLLALKLKKQSRQPNFAKTLGTLNRDSIPLELQDSIVENSRPRRPKFAAGFLGLNNLKSQNIGNSKLRAEPFDTKSEEPKYRSSDSTRHRVKRI